MTNPTIVFVPGAWHGPEIYGRTMDILNQVGYSTLGLPLPSVGASPPHTSFDGDVKGIRDCLSGLIEGEGKEVILVSHSYTGMLACEGPIGLAKSQREENGLLGGAIRLVFIMGVQYLSWMKVDLEKGVVNVEPEDAKAIFYSDLSSEEANKWAAGIRPQSVGVYTSTTTYAAWRYIPSTFVIGTEDKMTFTPEVVNFMIDSARKQVPSAFDVVETCEGGGHCLMISHPEWLAGAMRRAAGEKESKCASSRDNVFSRRIPLLRTATVLTTIHPGQGRLSSQ